MEKILAFSKEYNEKDPYGLYLKLFRQYKNPQYTPYLFLDFQGAISDKIEVWCHYYIALRLFADSEVKGLPLSRDEFEKANDFLYSLMRKTMCLYTAKLATYFIQISTII